VTTSESYGFLSTYPPTQCGLATFTESLAGALSSADPDVVIGVVRATDRDDGARPPLVVGELLSTRPGGEAAAATVLNRYGVAIIQHEYGIFGGRDGEEVIEVLRRLRTPSIVVLHTVLSHPTANQRRVLEHVARAASALVVMTPTARQRLLDGYHVAPGKVELIAHGVPTEWVRTNPATTADRSSLLTWGLLGPGKGIEWAVAALPGLRDIDPPVRYTVAGETHPHVLEREGEAYRLGLIRRAEELGVGHMLHFENRYLDQATLGALVRRAQVVVLPYDSPDQVTSGVLIEAVSSARPVVATGFPHALELLSSGAGAIVGHRDPGAIAAAVRRILTEPGVAESMGRAATELTADVSWTAIAAAYRALAVRLRADAVAISA